MAGSDRSFGAALGQPVAGNGLLHRRAFLRGGVAFGSAASATTAGVALAAGPADRGAPPWMRIPGTPMSGYGMPAHWQASVKRTFTLAEGRPGTGSSKTPLQLLDGTLTPNGLHFERHHNGVPDIDPSSHELVIHGLVKQPRAFTLESLLRYPLESHIRFIECTGNSAANSQEKPPKLDAGALHGLLSCSEWTGVRLSYLLDEVGLEGRAKWLIAEGADAAALSRSVPVEKALDDAMVALFQNGEAIRPEQGYPMRLLLPGFEGNINVKWLRRLKATTMPAHTKDETSKYSDLMPDGRARQFTLEVGVKSVILRPSPGLVMRGPGFYEISGIAWSGAGSIKRVQVSADGGRTWADAALNAPVLPKALTRFRIPWRWEGQPVTLMSRAIDDRRNVQPSRREWTAQYAPGQPYHYNALQSWAIDTSGKVTNVFV